MPPAAELPPNGSPDEGEVRRAALDTEQRTADAEQSAADRDQANSDRDRLLADADQRASDRDQAAANREASDSGAGGGGAAAQRQRDVSRAERAATGVARAQTATIRAQTALDRLEAANQRDESARARDLVAEARELTAEAQDHLAARYVWGPDAAARKRAIAERRRAAADRRAAAADRERARVDREALHSALSEAHVDDLTGIHRRAMGDVALQAEIERAHRSDGRLVVAFVDVDGLKEHDDREGHPAGDAPLRDVVTFIRAKLRSYDPVVRYGGDEFVCALSGVDLDVARSRFDEISTTLGQVHRGATISVGFAGLQAGDLLDDVIDRRDAALYEARRAGVR